jgi:hypothetical protein
MWFCKWKFVVIMPPGRKAQTVIRYSLQSADLNAKINNQELSHSLSYFILPVFRCTGSAFRAITEDMP